MSDSRWYFTEEQLANSPSRKCGINAEQELSYRQRAANLIQEIGQRLQVSQLCINTAIVYMHRFYAFHSFNLFHRNSIAAAAFFLAAKVEEQPRKLEHVIKILNICLEKNDNTREAYAEQAQELVFNENVLLQTLGFDVAIDHPHTHVVRACQLFNIVTVSRELRQTCYFMASNSLHLTTMCLKYKPTVVAAFCIYIACKWSRWEIPDSSEGKAWYSYVDENVTTDTLKKLTDEYLEILEKSPSKFKSKMKAITSNGQTALNTNPSVHARDDVPTTSSTKHHHHHHHNRGASSNTSSSANRKQPSSEISTSAPTSSSRQLQQQASAQTSSGSYKNQSMPQPGSNTHLPRQRPSSSSTSSSQQPYPGSSSSESTQKPVNEDRTQHRQIMQESSSYGSSMVPRQLDSSKQRTSSSQSSSNLSSSSQQQTNQQNQPPHVKPASHEQRHSLSSKPQVDYHPKSAKNPPSSVNSEFQNRGSSSSSHSQPQQPTHKKPSWPQQQQQQQQSSHPNNLQKSSQSNVQTSHSQPNLSATSVNSRNSSQTLPSYSESTKQASSSQASNTQNDYWFNEKILDTSSVKPSSPHRQSSKSIFSPSPEHEAFDKKMMMMNAVKRNDSPKSDKQDRRSSTPSKREKRGDMSTTPTNQKSSQSDRKQIPKLENSNVPPLIPDSGAQSKKRPFSSIDDALAGEYHRDSKARKVDQVKSEPTLGGPMMKQPIETNPDIVKSLLQECYTTSKFDSFGMDSPLDVINPDPAMVVSAFQAKTEMSESLMPSCLDSSHDNGFTEDHHKKSKSKKKKDKHKKKKKNHKSDREDRDDRKDSSIKIVFSKEKSDSKSSPEGLQTPGGLKIKIPMKDVNKTDLAGAPPPMNPLNPAPLKLKISKEKMGNFSQNSTQNVNDGGSSSSSSHKKKDKDRSKSKSSKHGNNNNVPDFKDTGFQHQQLSMNKMSSQVPMHSNPNASTVDLSAMFGNNSFPPQQQQQQQGFYQQPPIMNLQQQQHHLLQQQQFNNFNDFYQNPSMNYSSHNSSSSGNKK